MEKSFQIADMVWKTILSLGSRNNRFGKWSPSWEGPFRVTRIVLGNSYFLEALDGPEVPKAINGKYLRSIIPVYGKEHDRKIIHDGIPWMADNKMIKVISLGIIAECPS
jgi:hypothetical protein